MSQPAPDDAPARTYDDGNGGSIVILQEGDATEPMRFRMTLPQGFSPPAPECHPHQDETITVLQGALDLGKVDGEHVVLQEGETLHLPAGTFHLPANHGDELCVFEATLEPGHASADLFAELYTQTRHHDGLGEAVRAALVFRQHPREIRFPAPVRFGMTVMATLAGLFGLAPTPVPPAAPTRGRPPGP